MRNASRPLLLTAAAVGLAIAAAACGSTATDPSSAGPAPSVTSTSAPSASPTSTTSAPDSGSSGDASPRCHTGDLKVSDKPDAGGGAAGHHGELLVFENTAGHACSLQGYPGVSFVTGDSGKQVGSAFTRSHADTASVTLPPGDRAYATILLADPGNVGEADCKPVHVRGYRVYPPDETAAVFVSKPQTACATSGKAVGQVQPIAAHESDQ
ncbi:DUF4232 domain-containing protein [Actinoplanes sp. Pm04-4]|uniref:DUF4232 domain-containing protein n=1 Tax=Paractinoplanes pyxinae TaxID=2997416 RepID=A0ABT4BB56_9ACTN|nr:DUF4232 domain-containing protein [Actinoplanes pyxinae]MCY1143744.1 DUF4232 domain-containing protein [Actinoplanes pyxinae]